MAEKNPLLMSRDETLNAITELNREQNRKMWGLMRDIRRNESLLPIERYALGLFATRNALDVFERIEERIAKSVGQTVVGLGYLAKGDTFVLGTSTGQIGFREISDVGGGVGGVLELGLGRTFTASGRNYTRHIERGAIVDRYSLQIHHKFFPAHTADMHDRGVMSPVGDHPTALPENLYGQKELLAWENVNQIADIVSDAQAALEGRKKPENIFWAQ